MKSVTGKFNNLTVATINIHIHSISIQSQKIHKICLKLIIYILKYLNEVFITHDTGMSDNHANVICKRKRFGFTNYNV
jgi:hypothetical protein